jgi:peroxiredoxin
MKNQILFTGSFAVPSVTYAISAFKAHAAKVGEAAPDWTLSDTSGKTHSLKDYSGKFVVLEWTNHTCPYV